MNEIENFCQQGFRRVCLNGELAGEPLTGIKIVLANPKCGDESDRAALETSA